MGDPPGRNGDDWPDGTFAERLSYAIDRRGLGLQRIRAHLEATGISCSASTISLWRNGRTRPRRAEGKRAVSALEEILETPRSYLVDAGHVPILGSAEWWALGSPPAEVLPHGEEYAATLAEFGLDGPNLMNRLAIMDTLRFDENRAFTGSTLSYLIEATGDGVERMLVSTFSEHHTPQEPYLRISEARAGARLGRRRISQVTGQVMSEFIFDFPLRRGDVTFVELEVIPVDGAEPAFTGDAAQSLRAASPIGMLEITADFHRDALPVSVEQTMLSHLADPSLTEERHAPLELMGTRAVAHAEAIVAGGGLTLTANWEEDA